MVARPAEPESKMTMLFVALVCVLAAAVALVWLLVIKESPTTQPPVTPPVITQPSVQPPTTPGTAGTPASGELAETTIEADYPGVAVEVKDSDQRGKAPLVAKLSKGKSYTVKVEAPGYVTSELTVIGGNDNKIAVKLDAKPRVIQVSSTPSSASVYVDGNPIKKLTPVSIDLAKTQHSKKLRVMVRKIGFQPFFIVVKPEDFTDESDRMVFLVNAAMTAAVRVPAGGTEPAGDGTGSGDATEPAEPREPTTSEPKPADPAAPKPADPAAPKPADPAAPKPADPAAGSGEPAPDWTK
jgi:hypothetical protein